jgi:hypothetical protein
LRTGAGAGKHTVPVQRLRRADIPARFGFVRMPQPDAAP